MMNKIFVVFVFMFVFAVPSNAAIRYDPSDGFNIIDEKVSSKILKVPSKKKYRRKKRRNSTRIVSLGGYKMPHSVRNKLNEVQRKFGKIRILSTCRNGATVRKTGRPSMHRYCRAVDFKPPNGMYRRVANYLKKTWNGGVGTYSGRHNHIHIDDKGGRWHN